MKLKLEKDTKVYFATVGEGEKPEVHIYGYKVRSNDGHIILLERSPSNGDDSTVWVEQHEFEEEGGATPLDALKSLNLRLSTAMNDLVAQQKAVRLRIEHEARPAKGRKRKR